MGVLTSRGSMARPLEGLWFPNGQIWKSSIAYVASLSDGGREGALVMVL